MNFLGSIEFWLSLLVALASYSYFIYPLILRVSTAGRKVSVTNETVMLPKMTIIIAAYNEQSRLAAKLENTLALQYPRELFEVFVCSDASTDRTDAIALQFADRGVELLRNPNRQGKEAAQELGITRATGDILVFTDVSTSIHVDALNKIAIHMSEPLIGAISSEDQYIDERGTLGGEGAYVRYEMLVRRLESAAGGLVGLSGSFFAARRDVCRRYWRTDIPSDFATAIACRRAGLRAISAPDVIGAYQSINSIGDEYRRKKRTAVRGMRALLASAEMLNCFRWGSFAWRLASHKLMRWIVPWLMLATLILSAANYLNSQWAMTLFLLQLGFYSLAGLGALHPGFLKNTPVKVAFYFTQVNVALAHAAISVLMGEKQITWKPSTR